MAGAQVFKPLSATSREALVGIWVGNGIAETQTGPQSKMGCGYPTWQLNPLCHSAHQRTAKGPLKTASTQDWKEPGNFDLGSAAYWFRGIR